MGAWWMDDVKVMLLPCAMREKVEAVHDHDRKQGEKMRALLLVLSLMLIAQVAVAAPKGMEADPAGNYKNIIQCGYLALEMRKNEAAKEYFIAGEAMFREQNPEATEMDMAKIFSYERGFMHGYLAGQMGSVSSMDAVNNIFAHAYEKMCTKAASKPQMIEKKKK